MLFLGSLRENASNESTYSGSGGYEKVKERGVFGRPRGGYLIKGGHVETAIDGKGFRKGLQDEEV